MRAFSKKPFESAISQVRGAKSFVLFWAIALTAIAALLASVALLQYRWTREASIAEEMRIGAELESLMMKWHGDLYGELSAICIAMQVGPDSGARDTWNDYLERYVAWNYALPHETLPVVYRNPDLVGEIYIWETSHQGSPRLFHLNLDTRRIEPSQIPLELPTLLARLKENSSEISKALLAWQPQNSRTDARSAAETVLNATQSGSNSMAGWQFDQNVPAIVHPIFHRNSDQSVDNNSPVDWIVITVDLTVLQRRVLPELASRYFGGLEGLSYRVGVIATGKVPHTIYSSDPGFEKQGSAAMDSSMEIFGPRLEAEMTPPRARSVGRSEWHSFVGPAWFPIIDYGSDSGVWLLEVQHRAGPLQSIVRRVRERNLTVSAFVLVLLAVNIGFMTVAGFRAQRFARLQMDFVASVSHELRTPLTAIFSAGENLKDGVVTEDTSLKHYGELIISQARQLMKNVDRVLLFASLRSGRERYNLRPIAVTEIMQRVRNDTSALALEESCTIEERVEPGVSYIVGDQSAVSSCLENLVTNAIKYSGTDRRILLSASLEWTERKGYEVAINVEDHGLGIDGTELKHIFEPFYRSPKAVASQIHGTGLGLSLAKHLAEAMNGSLTVVSKIEVGSVFTLRLPIPHPEEHEVVTLSQERIEGDAR